MKEIESLFETYKNSVFQKDVEAYASIFDEEVLIFDMWAEWSRSGLRAWREMATDWFNSLGTERVVVSFDEIRIRTGGELATATAFVRFAAITQEGLELRFLQNRLTWVVQKKNNAWKIIHQHTSVPIDFETMKGMLKK
jgi:uncharacterized protein (TIGR02246 family)